MHLVSENDSIDITKENLKQKILLKSKYIAKKINDFEDPIQLSYDLESLGLISTIHKLKISGKLLRKTHY